MSAAPVVVVLTTYNAPPFLWDAVRSVMQQTYADFVCVIVDDGSTDDTVDRALAAVEGDHRFRVITQSNAGPSASRNRGARETQSELLAFLDHDDVWDERFLETLTNALDGSSAPAAHCVAQGITETGEWQGDFATWSRDRVRSVNRRLEPAPAGPTTFESLATAPCIASPGAVLMRREAFEQLGGFDLTLRICEDWDLWVKLARIASLEFVDEPLFFYRQHGFTHFHTHGMESRLNIAKLRRRIIAHPDNTPDQRRYARRAARSFYRNNAAAVLRMPGLKAKARGALLIAYSLTF